MALYHEDKHVEQQRYAAMANAALRSDEDTSLGPDGSEALRRELRAPYLAFERHLRSILPPGGKLLDVCCGSGTHSVIGAKCGGRVTASDFIPENIELTQKRARRAGLTIETVVSDAESLPFPDGTFDVVTCAGSLSYVDHDIFLREARRLLKLNGHFLCVDSLNHSPVYRFNRYIQYLRGKRTKSTLLRMPTISTVTRARRIFGEATAECFGLLSFACPVLTPVIGAERTTRMLDAIDKKLPSLGRFGFKIVILARKIDPTILQR